MSSEVREIISRLKRMSDADLSILHASLANFEKPQQQPSGLKRIFGSKAEAPKPVVLMTTQGSANDSLWGAMTELGWLQIYQETGELGELVAKTGGRQYEIVPEAVPSIRQALTDARMELAQFANEINQIFGELCIPFLEQLMHRTFAAGGNVPNAGMLLGCTLAEFAFVNGVEGGQDGAIDAVGKIAKDRLADFAKQGRQPDPA